MILSALAFKPLVVGVVIVSGAFAREKAKLCPQQTQSRQGRLGHTRRTAKTKNMAL